MDRGSRPSRADTIGLAVIALLAAIALLPWLDKPIFRDEGASLYSAHLSWTALWRQSHVVDLVLLPYYSFLHLWIELSGSIEWARFPSLIAFGVTILLAGRLGCRVGGRACGVVATLVVATNPLMISAALEARPYGLSVMASTAAITALVRWLDGGSRRWLWWFSLASVATLLLQMFSLLAPLSVLAVAIALRPRAFRAHWREVIAPVSILVAATATFAAVAAPQAGQISWIRFDRNLRSVVNLLLGPAYGGEKDYRALVFICVLAGAGLILLARRRGLGTTRRDHELFAIAAGWAALPALVLVAMSLVKPVYSSRYVTASVPGLAIAVALLTVRGFQLTTGRWPDRARLAAGGTAMAAGIIVVLSTCSVPAAAHASENFQDAAHYLIVHVGRDGSAALPDHSLRTGIDYYLQRDHESLRTWPQLAEQPYIDGLDLRQDRETVTRGPDNVWLVVDSIYPSTTGFTTTLARHGYRWVGTADLPGVQILHFRRKTS
jgi:hypothetical protein